MIVTMKRCLALLGILAVAATTAGAQQARVGPKWVAWIGCWTASPPGESVFVPAPSSGPIVCITPSASGDAADFTTIDSGKVVSTQRIDASGAEGPVDATGCTGVQRATWSADERRIYLRSSATCDGAKSSTSAILAISASGEWLDIHDVKSYGSDNVRVARYRDAGIPATLPEKIASALRDKDASAAARMAAGGDIGPTAIIEASRAVDSLVVADWLMERDQHFSVDAKTLVQLAEAGVPGAVTDVLVAASNPGVFQFARAGQPEDGGNVIYADAGRRRRVSAVGVPYDPWSWGSLGYGYPAGYGYGSLGYGGYGSYGYGNPYGYYGGYVPPIVVVTNGQAQSRGQMVKGRGYTQTQGSSSGTASERPRSTHSAPPPSSSSSGSSASSGSSSSSSGSGRTAKPRN
jgi:hypothetical protein